MTEPHSLPDRWRRAAVVRIYDVSDETVILGPDGRAHRLSNDSAHLARAVLSFTFAPRSRAEILAHLEKLAGGSIGDTTVIDELLALLVKLDVLKPAEHGDAEPVNRSRLRTRLVLCVTGAVAAMHVPALVQLLHRRGFEVRVAATETALRFVRAESLEALVHHPVVSQMFSEDPSLPVPHINLAQWADAVLVCPAAATTISRLATGDYSSVVSAIALSTAAPVVVAPSMNPAMYAHPAVQRNVEQLSADGLYVVHPASGHELADAPDQREPVIGPAPPHAAVVQILETVLRAARSDTASAAPGEAREWDELYRRRQPHELPWHSDDLDEDLAAALDREAPEPASVLDVGAGLGQVAIAAAKRGHRVVATDVSGAALESARRRAEGLPIVWLEDDVTDSRVHGTFEVVIDRGCLHLLPNPRLAGYASAVSRLTAAGGVLLLKTHDVSVGRSRGTQPYGEEEIEALLGDAFELASASESTFPGPAESPAARLFVLRRRRS